MLLQCNNKNTIIENPKDFIEAIKNQSTPNVYVNNISIKHHCNVTQLANKQCNKIEILKKKKN